MENTDSNHTTDDLAALSPLEPTTEYNDSERHAHACGIDMRPEGLPAPFSPPPPLPERLDRTAHLDLDLNNIQHFYEALVRRDAAHGTVMRAVEGEHVYNWLDAASPAWLLENADGIILACLRKMVIRHSALLESEFTSAGYTDDAPDGHITRGMTLKYPIKQYEKHRTMYLKTKERLEKLNRLDSINRRSRLAVLQFPANASGAQADSCLADGAVRTAPDTRDLSEAYELMRRANLTERTPILNDRGDFPPDWLENATQAELEDSTDTILFACAARMAIRMCVRVEKAWHQPPWADKEAELFKTDILDDIQKERDQAVNSYLDLREAQAKTEHNQGIVARSESGSILKKPRRPRMRTKKIAIA